MREKAGDTQENTSRSSAHSVMYSAAVIVGFGLFHGVSSSAYLSAYAFVESPFLFVPDLFFNVIVACSVIVCAGVAVALAITGKLKPLSMPYVLPTVLLLAANLAALVGVIASLPADVALLTPGLLYGAGSVMLSLFWIEVLAAGKPSVVVGQIALGMLLNVIVSLILSPMSGDVQMRLSCILLVVMTVCAWFTRKQLKMATLAKDKQKGESVACERVAKTGLLQSRWSIYRDAFLELGDSLIAFFILEAVIGLLNSFMLAGSVDFEGSGSVSVVAIIGAIIAFCFGVFVMRRIPKVSTVSRIIMPVLAAMLVFLPFLSERYDLVFTTLLLGSYYFVALLITYLIAETAHVRQVSSYVLMGATMGVTRVGLAIALLVGYAAAVAGGGPSSEGEHTMRYLVIIVVVLYALCMALVFFSRDRKRRRTSVEDTAKQDAISPDEQTALPIDNDTALEVCCNTIAQREGLTEREAEILVYLARGRTKAYIADTLFVSENTVRSHVRNIYSKLNIHTRQDLLDLVEGEHIG